MLPMEGTFHRKQDMQILSIKLRKSSIFKQKNMWGCNNFAAFMKILKEICDRLTASVYRYFGADVLAGTTSTSDNLYK
jgi:hypothetical protein